jgi:RHS repeat-associated protein
MQQIAVTAHGGGALSTFGYTNNADDNVTSFSTSSPTAQTFNYAYDKANRLQSSAINGVTQNAYGYDSASNLSSITANGSTQNYTYTSTNSITSGTYDTNGNPTALGANTYTWDGANRIVSFAGAGNKASSFTYDGLGRVVRIVDTTSGTVTADHSYFWCGSVRCLAHDNTQTGSPVSTQYFPQGAIVSGTFYYYVQDRLGSVTELVTTTGSVAAQYTYDAYGNRTTVSGTLVSDIGYAGYFYHASSGLNFALYRAYDALHARWLNRDPIGETGGVNLYAYTNGNPKSYIDPTGLKDTAPGYVFPTFPYGAGTPESSALGNLLTQAADNLNNNAGYVANAIVDALDNIMNNKPPEDATDPNGAKAPGQPGEPEGYYPPKGGPQWVPNPNPGRGGSSHGWKDKKGRVWCPTGWAPGRAHGGPHWDVETPGGGNENVRPVKPPVPQ